MTINLKFFLLFAAMICFIIKAFSVNTGRIDCMNLGFAFIVAAVLFG